MTNAEKVAMVKIFCEETDDEVISAVLSKAGDDIYLIADPYKTANKEEIVAEYSSVQIDLAAYYINKRGAEGQLSHGENGTSRTYEDGGIPASYLRRITPICGVTK